VGRGASRRGHSPAAATATAVRPRVPGSLGKGPGPRRGPDMVSAPVSRILCRPRRAGGGHLSGPAVTDGLVRPTRDDTGGQPCPCLALLLVGFAEPGRSPAPLVVSYTTVSPLPVPEGHRRSALCGTVRRVSPPGCYPAPCPAESGLSSTHEWVAAARCALVEQHGPRVGFLQFVLLAGSAAWWGDRVGGGPASGCLSPPGGGGSPLRHFVTPLPPGEETVAWADHVVCPGGDAHGSASRRRARLWLRAEG